MRQRSPWQKASALVLKTPIYAYRWTLRPWLGWPCRHLPTCSDYALEAIDKNGAWRGFWLTISRLARCQPWGTDGHDPVPDIRAERHRIMPWRYGRWTGRHIETRWRDAPDPREPKSAPPQSSASERSEIAQTCKRN
ncbi:MAG: membrane protein insertion efficiency factor YidD [Hyphomicrobiaceae bacterium]|nr:membrane protein insertion efficiency factor YidD [Hyphomicrobiaceae bacterium]